MGGSQRDFTLALSDMVCLGTDSCRSDSVDTPLGTFIESGMSPEDYNPTLS